MKNRMNLLSQGRQLLPLQLDLRPPDRHTRLSHHRDSHESQRSGSDGLRDLWSTHRQSADRFSDECASEIDSIGCYDRHHLNSSITIQKKKTLFQIILQSSLVTTMYSLQQKDCPLALKKEKNRFFLRSIFMKNCMQVRTALYYI